MNSIGTRILKELNSVFPCTNLQKIAISAGLVFKCKQNNMYYIIKVFKRGSCDTSENEVRTMTLCESVTCKLAKYFQCDTFSFVIIEYLEDYISLYDVITNGIYVDNESNIEIAKRLANALRYMHSKGIIHRDIKPSNIMVNFDTLDVRLIDFEMSATYNQYNNKLLLMGTYDFIDPKLPEVIEEANKLTFDQMIAFEIYSYGVTMFQFLSRTQSFDELNTDSQKIPHSLKITETFPSMCLELIIDIFPCFSFDTTTGKIDYNKFPISKRQFPKFD